MVFCSLNPHARGEGAAAASRTICCNRSVINDNVRRGKQKSHKTQVTKQEQIQNTVEFIIIVDHVINAHRKRPQSEKNAQEKRSVESGGRVPYGSTDGPTS